MATSRLTTWLLGLPMVLRVIALIGLACALTGAPGFAEEEGEKPPQLEVLARYEVPEMENRIIGVQWAGRDSIYLGLFERGVVEVELREGLPEVDHLFATGGDGLTPGLSKIVRFHVSDEWIVTAYNRFAWARRSSGGGPAVPMAQRTLAGPLDFAVDGDRVVMWGRPDKPYWEKAKGCVLWRADLSKGLDRWEVLYENDDLAADPDLMIENLAARGSVEFLDDGDVILAPNAPRVLPTVLRFSFSGKLKETWTAEEIWADREGEVLDDEEAEVWTKKRVGGKDFGRFLDSRRVIDAVLALPEGPAIVVREPKNGKTRWRLAVLSPEVRWYDIPVKNLSSVAQFRGDADDEGRIVMVGTTRELYDEVRVKKNEVVVMRLPLE